ncbi:MAG: TlpA family protein disulfide reductase [Flavobacteriales bacterium]|nr:TlpA family protein disulfide reductase [Flavobacteriales bacterium]
MIRVSLPLLFVLLHYPGAAQVLQGVFKSPPSTAYIQLRGTRGTEHPIMDSARINSKGAFAFSRRTFEPGFYQLSVNDTDRVDIILDPRESMVDLEFDGGPLQSGILVRASSENQRMWAYKRMSREAQPRFKAIKDERAVASPQDLGLIKVLAERERSISEGLEFALDSLVDMEPEGQFAFAVRIDRELDQATLDGPVAIRRVFDFSNPRYLRSSSYPKAIMVYLQRTPMTDEHALDRACDTLLHAAGRDTACWSFVRSYLIELFSTYGPAELTQYLVDNYVVGEASLVPPDDAVLKLAAEQLRLVNGAKAMDVELVDPGSTDTVSLFGILSEQAYTALFFYSSTCDHCHMQMPGLRRIVEDMDPRTFRLIGIALDADEQEFRQALSDHAINWSCYSHLMGWGEPAAKDYAVKATPALFLIDRSGRIVGKPMDHEELREMLEAN